MYLLRKHPRLNKWWRLLLLLPASLLILFLLVMKNPPKHFMNTMWQLLGALLVDPARARLNRRFLVAITLVGVVVILQTYAAFAMLHIRGLSAGT